MLASTILVAAALLALAFVHFIPTLVGVYRASHSRIGIFVLNLVLGWTVIGWFAALVWALTSEREGRSPRKSEEEARPYKKAALVKANDRRSHWRGDVGSILDR